jgi:hypothetical protein
MTNSQSIESDPDTIIEDLHRIRESIVDSFGGDLHKLTADARERQIRSGKFMWRGKGSNKPTHSNCELGPSEMEAQSLPTVDR